jgi:hypothetical protein
MMQKDKCLIFMLASLLLIVIVYPSSSMDASAIKAKSITLCESGTSGSLSTETCCYWESDSETETTIEYCTECITSPGWENYPCTHTQTDVSSIALPTPTPSPPAPENALPQGDVQQPSPTLPPTGGKGLFGSEVLPSLSMSLGGDVSNDDGILEQPPLFGRNIGNAPLGGFFGQEPTTDEPSPEPTPVLSSPPSPPVATDVSPDLAPEEDVGPFPPPPTTPVPPVPPPGQEGTDDGRDDLLPDTGITEQPEVQQPEQEQKQEEPSNEGKETAGPLT